MYIKGRSVAAEKTSEGNPFESHKLSMGIWRWGYGFCKDQA